MCSYNIVIQLSEQLLSCMFMKKLFIDQSADNLINSFLYVVKELETSWDNPKNWTVKSNLPESQVLSSIKFS